jgi:long-chain acyl-CoA synthetase
LEIEMTSTIVERFTEQVRAHPDKVALRYKTNGRWQDITWAAYGHGVRRAGKGLMSLGFEPSDKMAVLSRNRPEWHLVDIACMSIGGTTAPVYVTNSPEQVRHVVGHSDSKIAVVENPEQLEKILKVRSELPVLQKVVVIEGYAGDADGDLVMTWEELLSAGDSVSDDHYAAAVAAVKPNDLATLVYTSGTTGSPKGVMLTHANVWWTATVTEQHIPLPGGEDGRAISYLPLSHIAERMISHFLQIYYGSETWFAESIETLLEDMKDCKPTYFFGVPRVWEKFYAGVQAKMAAADPNDRKTKLAVKAIGVGRSVTQAEQEAVALGKKMAEARISLGARIQHAVLDKLVLHKIRAALGFEKCDLALSAAAPLSPEVVLFFHSVGIKVTEGYGQSEDCGPTTWNPPDAVKIGTVGTPFPGIDVRLAADGEVLVRGGNVFPGYYKNEEATRLTIDDEGWLHSGDIGDIDEFNYLKITDRKKDIIITAGGKNIAPQEIENLLKSHPLISQVVVIGDRRPFLTALITLDEEKYSDWARQHGISNDMAAVANHAGCHKEIEDAVLNVNRQLAKVEGVKKVRILERDFLQEENEITPTLKVKRRDIGEIYADVIEDMYAENSPPVAAARAPERR